jgi:hypothetical protein
MTEQLHPMVPPNILLNNWESDWFNERENVDVLLIQAYQAGADAELEACCEWLACDWTNVESADKLRAARRSKPPSLKEQALKILEEAPGPDYPRVMTVLDADQHALIRRALEALPND